MHHTQYSCLSTEELLRYCLGGGCKTPLELELAQRLELAVDMLVERVVDDGDTGSEGQKGH